MFDEEKAIKILFIKPTEVMQVIVKYNAVTYIVRRGGPFTNSGSRLSFDQT